jgi:hypothetical protein
MLAVANALMTKHLHLGFVQFALGGRATFQLKISPIWTLVLFSQGQVYPDLPAFQFLQEAKKIYFLQINTNERLK